MKSLIGQTLGPYHVIAQLGAGSSGEVYRATDVRLSRDVALKVFHTGVDELPGQLIRFHREARTASSLNHPNIVTIHDIGGDHSTPYIAMEFVNGMTLRQLLNSSVPETDVLLDLSQQIAEGLSKAHQQGILHRDLKPENLMITEDGLVKILDFGLSELWSTPGSPPSEMTTMTTAERLLNGTIAYMSPEQARGDRLDYTSDQFSFGIVMYEMATGCRPFQRPTAIETLAAIIGSDVEPLNHINPLVPARFSALVERCLSKHPGGRYASTREIARQLHTIRADLARTRGLHRKMVVAVLPFEEISSEAPCGSFCRGIVEEIRNQLSGLPSIALLSRYAFPSNQNFSLSQLESYAHADHVIEGSVRLSLGRVRIAAALVDVTTGHSIWSGQYDRDFMDPFSVQTEVAAGIINELLQVLQSL